MDEKETTTTTADVTSTEKQPDTQTTASGDQTKEQQKAAETTVQAKTYYEEYVKNLQAQQAKAVADAVAEAVKKEKMSAEEKARYEADKKQADIEKREKEIALRELKADTRGMLAKANLPENFVDMVVGMDAESTQKNIDALGRAFSAAVQEQVEARLKGKTPKTGTGTKSETDTGDMEAQMNKIMGL